jgi:hypothetical protein
LRLDDGLSGWGLMKWESQNAGDGSTANLDNVLELLGHAGTNAFRRCIMVLQSMWSYCTGSLIDHRARGYSRGSGLAYSAQCTSILRARILPLSSPYTCNAMVFYTTSVYKGLTYLGRNSFLRHERWRQSLRQDARRVRRRAHLRCLALRTFKLSAVFRGRSRRKDSRQELCRA